MPGAAAIQCGLRACTGLRLREVRGVSRLVGHPVLGDFCLWTCTHECREIQCGFRMSRPTVSGRCLSGAVQDDGWGTRRYSTDVVGAVASGGRADSAFGNDALPASEACSRDDEAAPWQGARQVDRPAARNYDWYSALRKTLRRFKGAFEGGAPYYLR